ncbi:MAG: hydantoinase B/oxoprolinase family protein [Candidatus Latescibacteria bacterium]|nr:hydantoinase B/oxoprolinase family protein [Candidatus Latescibacterota bacterium]NIM64466.1 hydantoinase B/oxoprolinase family protein [Candidatus Latescibacterota bacterium]NIO00619.1 hydantoinase B/oxoprolinase family protein [Candidatus Latescibacterota bacterium]NIO27020.1 hydantoinase B/oxoprolinase family protein [Candidatus Latescibacterota bacterium]NIO56097.1 hydantoinase B/oxoprolinase family protein [Candidatus Latescibacterota bacterium]
MKIDKILASVFQRRFKSITEEMSIALTRTTRSPILCEAKDFVTGLYDGKGKMLEQTENLPILSFSLGPVCEYIVEYFGDEIYPGDVIFHNDVFSMGNQNNDVAVYKPIFYDGRLVAWAAAKGHQADIGGAVAGGYNPRATEVWQEALRIPPVKVYEKGKLRKDVWDLIFANIRFDIVAADMRAQIGSCVVGERGILRLVEKYGIDVFESHKRYLFDSTEKMMVAEIKTIPNGVYTGEATVYYDGRTPGSTYTIRVKITVEDERITFDYSDTDPQTEGFVNGTYTSSASATLLTFLQMVNPDIPHNDGMVRPVNIIIPEGTILNAKYPAATTFGNHLCPPNADAIIRALSQAIPERITAGWNQLLCYLTTGYDRRKKDNYVDIGFLGLKGGSGATNGVDGYDHIGMIDASGGVLDQDYEMFEQQTPHLLLEHEYWRDSAGAGQWRGGLGVETKFKIGGEQTKVVTFGDGDVEPAFGLFGGKESTLNKIELHYPDGNIYKTTTKDLIENVPEGTILFQHAGGGGGYGDPLSRDPQKVALEVKNGIISIEQAKESYGVVVDPENFSVDIDATKRQRGK